MYAQIVTAFDNEDIAQRMVSGLLLIGTTGGKIEKIRKEFTAVQFSFPDLRSKSDIVKL